MAERIPTTPRRTMQQIIHCVEEALSAYQENEVKDHVLADLEQARELLDVTIKAVKNGNRVIG